VYDPTDRVVLHPDIQVQQSVRMLFETFQRTGAASATVKAFKQQNLLFPAHVDRSHRNHEVLWRPLSLTRAVAVLHNPRYAGAYAYGRRRVRGPGKRGRTPNLPREQWTVLLLEQHPGYIDWAEYERNQRQLAKNRMACHSGGPRPPREGPALLQGLVLCGHCGTRMAVTYHHRKGRLIPTYFCVRRRLDGGRTCQSIAGDGVDTAVGQLVVEAMIPVALNLTLAVQDELQSRLDEAGRLRQHQVERAEYDVERARQRYMQVDPANRLVASTLEADWNQALRVLEQTRRDVERQRQDDAARFDQATRERIRALAEDFPALWSDPRTPQRERKRMLALLVEDVTLLRSEQITAHVRFRGGATTTLTLPLPDQRKTRPEVVAQADVLLAEHTDREVAAILNERGHTTGVGAPFDAAAVAWLRRAHQVASLKERLIAAGGLTTDELAPMLGITANELRSWARRGRLLYRRCNDRGERIYASLDQQPEPIRCRASEYGTPDRTTDAPANRVGGAV